MLSLCYTLTFLRPTTTPNNSPLLLSKFYGSDFLNLLLKIPKHEPTPRLPLHWSRSSGVRWS